MQYQWGTEGKNNMKTIRKAWRRFRSRLEAQFKANDNVWMNLIEFKIFSCNLCKRIFRNLDDNLPINCYIYIYIYI